MQGNLPGAVEILGGGLIAPEVILGAVKDKTHPDEEDQVKLRAGLVVHAQPG